MFAFLAAGDGGIRLSLKQCFAKFVFSVRHVVALYDFPGQGEELDCFHRFDRGRRFRMVFLFVWGLGLGLCCAT